MDDQGVSVISDTKACPHCGGNKATYMDDEVAHRRFSLQYQVVCDMTIGGCGASSGWAATKEEALANWERRPNLTAPYVRVADNDLQEPWVSYIRAIP